MVYRPNRVGGVPLQYVIVTSEPSGATVRLDGVVAGVTPARVGVRRKGPLQTLSLQKDGYESERIALERGLSPATYGNLAFAALALNPLNGPNGLADNPWSRGQQVAYAFVFPAVGFAADLITGAGYAVRSPMHVTLRPSSGATTPASLPRR